MTRVVLLKQMQTYARKEMYSFLDQKRKWCFLAEKFLNEPDL